MVRRLLGLVSVEQATELNDEAFALIEPMIARVMAGEHVSAERELPYRDGGPRSVHIDYVPDRGEDGAVAGFFALVQDISERRRAERALRESEGRFHAMADSVDQMIWSTLPDGHHDYYNRRWYEYTGVPEGSTDGEAWNGMFHPDDRDRAWEVWRRSLASGEPYQIEYRLRHRSGDYRWVLGRAQAVRDENGAIARWYGTCTDIHDLKLAEEALRESEARFRAMADSAPAPVWVTGPDGIEFANRAFEEVAGVPAGVQCFTGSATLSRRSAVPNQGSDASGMGQCEPVHGARARDVQHPSVYVRMIVLGRYKRNDHLIKLKTLRQVRRCNNHPTPERSTISSEQVCSTGAQSMVEAL